MSIDEIPPLPSDPSRQADAMLRACEYQIIQTVNAWLDLRGEEVIEIEGAEDFDLLHKEWSEAVQIKTSPKPISLGQKEIQIALNNFWKLRVATGGRHIKLRYLTCAPITVERERPLGDQACLEIWQRNEIDEREVLAIAKFLANQPHIDKNFKSWIETSDVNEIKLRLINCVTWQTHAEDADFVERGIHNKLAALAPLFGPLPSSVIQKLRRRLVEEVWKVIRQKGPRRLDYFKIQELWEDEGRISVPRATYDALLEELFSPSSSKKPSNLLQKGPPPLPGKVANRPKLIQKYETILSATGFLNISGSTRTGKTTIAKLIAAQNPHRWKWWSAARKGTEQVRRELTILSEEIILSPDVSRIILDDLDFSPTLPDETTEVLGELISLVRSRKGQIVITSQRVLPYRLRHAFGIEALQVVTVPRMDSDEISELATTLGCDVHKVANWANAILASTEGHPQLVAVRLLSLKDRNWPAFSIITFDVGSQAIDSEKADAQQLINALPPNQRELIQRISAFPSAFRRDHAVLLGAAPPPLDSPGNSFDPLVGPWIEPLHDKYYSLSPLLDDGARRSLDDKAFKSLQDQALEVLINSSPLTSFEISSAFFLGWQTNNVIFLREIGMGWLDQDENLEESLLIELSWFRWVSIESGQILYEEDRNLSLLLRLIQFRISMRIGINDASQIYQLWREEIRLGPDVDRPLKYGLLGIQALLSTKFITLSANLIVEALGYLSDFASLHPDANIPGSIPLDSGIDYLPHWDDPVSAFAFISTARCDSIDFLDDFLESLDSCPPDLRKRILVGAFGRNLEAIMTLDRVWLAESDRQSANWDKCIRIFKKALAFGRSWGCAPLSDAAARGICVVMDEYLLDREGAHLAVDRMQAEGGLSAYIVFDRRAGIFFGEQNYEAAESNWKLALENWPAPISPFDSYASFAARSAGVAASRLNKWDMAAHWFFEILNRLPDDQRVAMSAGAYADAGYCLWKAGKPVESVNALIEAWLFAERLPSGKEDLRSLVTRKTVSHVIAWLNGIATTDFSVDLHEPQAGVCSSAETPEAFRELPESDDSAVWLFLMRLERECGRGTRASDIGISKIFQTRNSAVISMAQMEIISQSIHKGTIDELPREILSFKLSMDQSPQSRADSFPVDGSASGARITALDEDDILYISGLISGLIVAFSEGKNWHDTLKSWRESLPDQTDVSWASWFDQAERVLGGELSAAEKIVRQKDMNWSTCMLASWLILTSDNIPPDSVFFAHARWLLQIPKSPWLKQTAGIFCEQVQRAWAKIVLKRAILNSPMITVPAIISACSGKDRSPEKAARILLAAQMAVGVGMDNEIREEIFRISKPSIR